MTTVTTRAHVGPDGILRLEMPVNFRDADLEVTLNMRTDSELQEDAQSSESPMEDECCLDAELEEAHRHVVYEP